MKGSLSNCWWVELLFSVRANNRYSKERILEMKEVVIQKTQVSLFLLVLL